MATPVVIANINCRNEYLAPLLLYRPLCEIRVGGFSLRERVERLMGGEEIYLMVESKLQGEVLKRKLNVNVQEMPNAKEFLIIDSGLVADFATLKKLLNFLKNAPLGHGVLKNGLLLAGKVDGSYLSDDFKLKKTIHSVEFPGSDLFIIDVPWRIIEVQGTIIAKEALSSEIKKDFNVIEPSKGSWPVFVSKDGADIESPVYWDTRNGPILIGTGVEVQAFTRITGPTFIREKCKILSALIREDTVVGPLCKIGGEVEASLIDGFSNKSHESYVGHSYVGEWVNIGAFTVTSNLKNTYGTVKVELNGKRIDSKFVKLGAFICDFAKTSSQTLILPGKYIGCFSHVTGPVTFSLPPFVIWNGYAKELVELRAESAAETQKRMYGRRGITQLPEEIEYIRELYELTVETRKATMRTLSAT